MKAFAQFITRNTGNAIIVTLVTSALSLLLPLLAYLSSATIALVVLKKGLRSGLVVALLSALLLMTIGTLMGNGPSFPFLLVLVFWLPVLLLAACLRYTVSLGVTINAAALAGLAGILVFYAVVDQPTQFWLGLINPFLETLQQQAKIELGADELSSIASLMTGFVATGIITGFIFSLFIARWWHATIDNPGGFQSEYLALDLGRRLSYITMFLVFLAVVLDGMVAEIALNGLVLVISIYMFQGISFIHMWFKVKKTASAWLFVFYLLMVFMPQFMLLISILGYVDSAAKLKARLKAS